MVEEKVFWDFVVVWIKCIKFEVKIDELEIDVFVFKK